MKITFLKRLNINTVLKILLLLGFAAFFLYSVLSGSANSYVHPRIIPYIIFTAVVMIIIALLFLGNLLKYSHEKSKSWQLLFFIIPLIMAFYIPAVSFSTSTETTDNLQLSAIGNKSGNTPISSKTTVETESSENNSSKNSNTVTSSNSDTSSESINSVLELHNGVLIMTDSNYNECMNEIYTDIDKYAGIKIEVVGYVFKDNPYFTKNEFVPARLMMVCCAADMVSVGLLCKYNETASLESDSWVKVTGTLGKTNFKGDTVPYIEVESVTQTEKPKNEYVYPY